MKHHQIKLFVMPGCQVCPQMEHLFEQMHQQGAISELEVFDVQQHPELAEQHNIRSVPHYLINGVAFTGLKSRREIDQLLDKTDADKWIEMIQDSLAGGELEPVEQAVRKQPSAREAMIVLLDDPETALLVRIGLTAVIETLATEGLLNTYEQQFIRMTTHDDERIAVDALYYLSLINTPDSLATLQDLAENGSMVLREHALELLQDEAKDQVLH